MSRSSIFAILRIATSAVLIAILVRSTGPNALWQTARSVDLGPVVAGVVVSVLLVGLYAYRWQALVAVHGSRVSMRKLVSLYLVGSFFNTFLPTSFGGDVARIAFVARDSPNRACATAAVLMDRLVGLVGLIIVALAAILGGGAGGTGLANSWQLELVLFAILLGISVAVIVLSRAKVRRRDSAKGSFDRFGLRRGSDHLIEAIAAYRQWPGVVAVAVVLSMVSQLGAVTIGWLFARAAHMDISVVALLVIIPVVTIVTMLPLSINGLGVQDTGFVAMLQPVGVDMSTALLFSLLWHSQRYICGLVGGLLYAFGEFVEGV